MGLFGGSSKSSTTQNTITDSSSREDYSVTTSVDSSWRDNSTSAISSVDNSVNTITDGGSIVAMREVSLAGFDFGEEVIDVTTARMEATAASAMAASSAASSAASAAAQRSAAASAATAAAAMDANGRTFGVAVDAIGMNSRLLIDSTRELFGEANQGMSELYQGAQAGLGDSFESALLFAEKSARSEGAQLAEGFQKTLLIGGGIIAAILIVPKVFK